jgi:hypothetical protein
MLPTWRWVKISTYLQLEPLPFMLKIVNTIKHNKTEYNRIEQNYYYHYH